MRGDLIRIMTKLLARPEKLDMIIIETTGDYFDNHDTCCRKFHRVIPAGILLKNVVA